MKYWVERKISASMNQSQLLRQCETVSYEQQAAAEGNEVTLGSEPKFDFADFDSVGDQAAGGDSTNFKQASDTFELSRLNSHTLQP